MNIKYNVNAMRIGWYSDKYFLRTQEILINDGYEGKVHYQYFPRKDNVVVCGIPHVLQILLDCTGYYKDREKAWNLFQELQKRNMYDSNSWNFLQINQELNDLWVSKFDELEIYSLSEGVLTKEMEPVIGIIGNPKWFIHLETPTLGVLAQQSAIATSVKRVIDLLNPDQKLLFFPARFRHYSSQAPDGYAAAVGGAKLMSTDSNGEYWGYDGIGTIPHALIAAYNGDTALAALKFDDLIDPAISRIVLVDWDNDCIGTSLRVVAAFLLKYPDFGINHSYQTYFNEIVSSSKESEKFIRDERHLVSNVIGLGKGKVFGVRFDTSGSLIDKSIKPLVNFGVCPELVFKAREKFDELGLHDLKIIISGGFDEEKIRLFQKAKVPFDMVGIGSSIVNKFTVDFTADAVMLDGKPNAKVGRCLMDWSRMNASEMSTKLSGD